MWEATRKSGDPSQPVVQEMQLEAWVGLEDRIIRAERVISLVGTPVSSPSQIGEVVQLDAKIVYTDVNRPLSIVAPPLRQPAAALATPEVRSAPAPVALPPAPVQPAPPVRSAPAPAPAPPVIAATVSPEPEEEVPAAEPEPTPADAMAQADQILAAERARAALATPGQPRSGSTARGHQALLDVPFRTQQDSTLYAETNAGPAGLAMALASYGIEVPIGDLRALINGLEGVYSPRSQPKVETFARIAELGGLNTFDLYRGARFNEWTVEAVRDTLRKGYPIMTLAQGVALPGGTPPGAGRERFITLIGTDGEDIVYHDPAYPDEGDGATLRISGRTLEQAWLAASTPRLGVAFGQGTEARSLFGTNRSLAAAPAPSPGASPAPVAAPVTALTIIQSTPEPPTDEAPPSLPVHPVLLVFWSSLVFLLLAILVRTLKQ